MYEINYESTHQSIHDDSPAMFISEDNEAGTYNLMNEDGHTWTDPQDDWVSIAELEHDSLMQNMSADLRDDDPMGYESDSYMAYLNKN